VFQILSIKAEILRASIFFFSMSQIKNIALLYVTVKVMIWHLVLAVNHPEENDRSLSEMCLLYVEPII